MNNETINKRENFPHYIGVDSTDEKQMLESLGLNSINDLFSHISNDVKHSGLIASKVYKRSLIIIL